MRRVAFSVTMNWLKAFRPGLFKHLGAFSGPDGLDLPDFAPGPAEEAEKNELADAVLSAVASLPPKYRVPLTMFHLDGLSYRKVAEFLEVPLGTAKSLIHRAREKLRPALAAYAVTTEVSTMVQEVFEEHKLPEEFARKVIDGLQNVRWGGGEKENSTMGALSTALQVIGEDYSYEMLMGLSGAAFRVQIHKEGICPSSPHSACGFDCAAQVLSALPYDLEHISLHEAPEDRIEKAREAARESLDRGVPVLAGSEEESLIVGYEEGGERFLLRPYAAWEPGYKTMEGWPWGIGLLRKKDSPPPLHEAVVRSLELATEFWRTPEFNGYFCGERAYASWIERLRDDAEPNQVGNGHCYYCLLDARGSAEIYLRDVAGRFDEPVQERLLKAADICGQIVKAMTVQCPTVVAPMPWMQKEGQSWTAEMRSHQADILEQVRGLDEQAVAEVQAVLDLL